MSIQAPAFGSEVYGQGSPGRFLRTSGNASCRARIDAEGASEQVDVISIAGAENSSLYSIRVVSTDNGQNIDETVEYTTDGSATTTELRDGLIAALLANASILAVVEYPVAGTDEITLTANRGRTFTVTFPANPTTDLTVVSTAAAAAPSYLYGDAVEVVAPPSGQPTNASEEGIQSPADVAGSVVTWTVTHATTETLTSTFLYTPFGGTQQQIDLSAATGANAGATDTAWINELEAEIDGASATAAVEGTVVLTLPAGATGFVLTAAGSGSADLSGTVTTNAADLPRMALVMDERATAPVESRTGLTTVTGPDPASAPLTLDPGDGHDYVFVPAQSGNSYTRDGIVYVGTTTSEKRKLYTSPSATRVPFPGAKWVGLSTDSSVAIIRL